jgi:hypothetical protein
MIEKIVHTAKQAVKAKVLTHRAEVAPGAAVSEADTTRPAPRNVAACRLSFHDS